MLRDHDAFPGQDLGKVPISQLADAKARGFFHATPVVVGVPAPPEISDFFRETGRHFAKEKL